MSGTVVGFYSISGGLAAVAITDSLQVCIMSLQVVNATHAFYNWTRVACFNEASTNNMNFDAGSCATDGDNSPDASTPTDTTWIVRSADRSVAGCSYGGCTQPVGVPPPPAPPPPHASPPPEASSKRDELTGTGVAGWVLFAISAFGNFVFCFMQFREKRAPATERMAAGMKPSSEHSHRHL